jgi:hypothetical protein
VKYDGQTARKIAASMPAELFLNKARERMDIAMKPIQATQNFKTIAERHGFWDENLMVVS